MEQLQFPEGNGKGVDRVKFDGISIFMSQAAEVDSAVRQGASLALDHEIFRLMNRDADGRRASVLLLCAVTEAGSFEKIDRDLRISVNSTFEKSFVKFSADWLKLQKSSPSSILHDYSPAGSVGTPRGWSGNAATVTGYDIARLSGNHGLPSAAMPSNPQAFFKPPIKVPSQISGAANAFMLARTIGMTPGDRKFIVENLADSAKRINKPKVTAASLAREVFESTIFESVRNGGELPDRDERVTTPQP
jgi:hypothetical protein